VYECKQCVCADSTVYVDVFISWMCVCVCEVYHRCVCVCGVSCMSANNVYVCKQRVSVQKQKKSL
jgi:hypothetical protein